MKDPPPLAIAPQKTAAPRTQQGVCSAERTGHECTGCNLCKLVRPKHSPPPTEPRAKAWVREREESSAAQ